MIRLWILLIVNLVTPVSIVAQKMLLLETRRIKPVKFYPGEELTFKLQNDPLWYTRIMYELVPATQSIVISNNRDTMHLSLSQITHIRNPYKGRGWKWPSRLLMGSGAGLIISAVVYDVFELGPSIKEDPIPVKVGLSQVAAGYVIKKLLEDQKRVKMNDHHRLRIIDLTL